MNIWSCRMLLNNLRITRMATPPAFKAKVAYSSFYINKMHFHHPQNQRATFVTQIIPAVTKISAGRWKVLHSKSPAYVLNRRPLSRHKMGKCRGLELQYNTNRGITNNNNVGRHVTVMNSAVGVVRGFWGRIEGGSFTFSRVAIPFVESWKLYAKASRPLTYALPIDCAFYTKSAAVDSRQNSVNILGFILNNK